MIRTKLKRICSCLLCIVILSVSSALASAVYVVEDTAAYSAPDTGSAQYGTLEAGTKVTVTAYNAAWARIVSGKKTAYVSTGDLAAVKSCGGITVYTVDETNVYRTFRTSSAFAVLPAGEAVRLSATVGDWAYVTRGGSGGLVRKSALSTKKPAGSADPADPEQEENGITAYVKAGGVRAYRSASASSKVLCTLSCNDTVLVTKVSGSWCRCTKDGAVGYIRKSDLSTSKVDPTVYDTFIAYAKEDGTKVYDSSSSVIASVKQNTELTVTAYNSSWARVRYSGGTAFVKAANLSTEKIPEKEEQQSGWANGSSTKPATGTAVEIDWWTGGIRSIIPVGREFTITDVSTGIAWREKRVGGSSHLDSTPVTAEDTAAMKKACKSWSWDRRAVFVTVDGVNYAASINCKPHGTVTNKSNGFGGHHCVHFTNSRTHGTDKVCPLHQAAIKKAAKATLK